MKVQYSRPGRTMCLYAVSLSLGGQRQRFLCKNPIDLFGLQQIQDSLWFNCTPK